MATLTPERRAYKDTGSTTDIECIRIELQDGTIHRFTNAFNDIEINYANVSGVRTALGTPVTYQSTTNPPKLNAVGVDEGQSASIDIEGAFDPALFTRDALASGKFNKARVTIFTTNYEDPTDNDEIFFAGYWGEATAIDGRYVLKFRSLIEALTVETGRVFTELCDTTLGSTRCGVKLIFDDVWQASFAYTGREAGDSRVGDIVKTSHVNSTYYWLLAQNSGTSDTTEPGLVPTEGGTVLDNDITWETVLARTLTAQALSTSITTEAVLSTPLPSSEFDNYYQGGSITFLSGNNGGSVRRIVGNTTTTFTLSSPLEFPPQGGDTATIVAGCRKRHIVDCTDKFNNYKNFQGFPYLPGLTNIRAVGEF